MAGNMLEFTEANFTSQVLESSQPVLVDFWAPWCGPCKMLGPTIEEISNDYAGKVRVGKLNTDEAGSIASQYGIQILLDWESRLQQAPFNFPSANSTIVVWVARRILPSLAV